MSWSPDESEIAVSNEVGDLMEAPYEVLGPAWSPDGSRIAFHRLVLTPGNGNGNGFRIDVAEIDSIGNVTAEPTYEFNRLSDDELAVQWLPNGQDIIFQRFDGGKDYLAMVRPETGAVARDLDLRTTNGDIDTMRTTISPDGRFLVTHLLTDDTDWVVDLASGTATHADIDGEDFVHIQRRAP